VNRLVLLSLVLAATAACGDNHPGGPLIYSNPSGGALRLVKARTATPTSMVLDLVVGDQPLTGYSAGFDLPLAHDKVTLVAFTPGTALDPGSAPVAALGVIGSQGPLADVLFTGQSQKAAGTGAVTTDTVLAPHTVLYSIELAPAELHTAGVVFDGTADGFVVLSGGLRDKVGLTVVEPADVAIGKLEVE
jgi:hypothetical protein